MVGVRVAAVSLSASSPTVKSAPADYDELVREYGENLRVLVRSQLGRGSKPQDIEDVYQYILTQFFANDVITQYQPDHVSEFNGKPVSFLAFIRAKATLYCKGRREAIQRQAGRELQIADTPVGDHGHWIEVFGGAIWDDYEGLTDEAAYVRLHEFLASRPRKPDELNLAELLDELDIRVSSGEAIGPEAIRKVFGLTRASTASYMQRLRDELKLVARRDTYEVGGIVLTAAQMRTAIDALAAYPGHHVLPAFRAVSHPLAGAGKTWYISFAKAEIKAFPELRQPPGGHFSGGHGNAVKAALIHRLERMLNVTEEPEPVVPAGPGAWRTVESALRKLPGCTDERIEVVMELARQVFEAAA
jgi:DNA-directed RNA polymerase specialized sigma24 family protein